MTEIASEVFRELYLEPSRNGLTKPKKVRGVGVKMVNMGEIFAHGRIRKIPMDRVPLTESESVALLAPGDLLFARQSLILSGAGKCSIFLGDDEPVCFESHIIRVRVDPAKANSLCLYYFFQSPLGRAAIESIVEQGAGVAGIRASDLSKLVLRLPKRSAQDRVAMILSVLDDKIDLNRRMNETLEEIAQEIFKDWFVDFGPVRRKQAGAPDPIAIMGGLTQDPTRATELVAQFPDEFGDDGLPEGWQKSTLAQIATVNTESWKASNHPDFVDYVDLSNTKWGVIESTSNFAWAEAPSRARRIAKSQDTIVGTVRPGNGSYAYIAKDGYTVSTGFAVLRPSEPEYADALYIASTRHENIQRLANLADGHGGAYPAVNPDVVLATELAFSGHKVLSEFNSFARPLRDKIEYAKEENLTLAETRDYLLPKLMSGEARAYDTEKLVEGHVV